MPEKVHLSLAEQMRERTELRQLFLASSYLYIFLAAFLTYRALLLSEGIDYFNYLYALVESLTIAHSILLGMRFKLGEGGTQRPLIYPTVQKAIVYAMFVLFFSLAEDSVKGFILHGQNPITAFQAVYARGLGSLLARNFIVMITFVPFFAFIEIGRIVGHQRLYDWFLIKAPERMATDP